MTQTQTSIAGVRKWFFAGLGGLFFSIGIIGIFLPLLPTVPFMLLALWAFSRGSRRWHDYIYYHPRFGHAARQWQQYRAVPRQAKISAVSVMSLSAAYLVFWSNAPGPAIAAALAVMIGAACYLITRPSEPVRRQSPCGPAQIPSVRQ